MIQQSTHNKDW